MSLAVIMALTETSFVLDENDDKQLEQMCTSDEQSTEDSDKNVNVVTLKYRWQKTTALYACFIALVSTSLKQNMSKTRIYKSAHKGT